MSAPTLAEVQALAGRCKAGDPEALRDYPDAARALLDDIRQTLKGDEGEREAEYKRLWREIVLLGHVEAAGERALLPCPFCGAGLVPGAQGLEIREDGGWHTIGCAKCGVEQGFVKATREEAIAAWNRRHPGDALRSAEVTGEPAVLLTVNEARALMGMAPVKDGDAERLYTLAVLRAEPPC